MKAIVKFFSISCAIFVTTGAVMVLYLYFHMVHQLPEIKNLNSVQLQVPMRIYSRDHQLIAQYGEKRRTPVTLEHVPEHLIHAILATEDQRFFEHPGVDIWGLLRAAKIVFTSGSRSQGGSTITMQVARNFYLSRKKTYTRKINEILLAIKIDSQLSKKKILELYLNKIYFGNRAYGVEAAAQVYYGTSLTQLTLPQLAMLAGLPKAPSALNPLANPEKALKRRNHVLARMLEQEYISDADYQKAISTPLTATYHELSIELDAPYVAELAREMVVEHYGKDSYDRGLQVYTSVDSRLQRYANSALQNAIMNYDRRHGFRGPEQHWSYESLPIDREQKQAWLSKLNELDAINGLMPAVITEKGLSSLSVLTAEDKIVIINEDNVRFKRPKEWKAHEAYPDYFIESEIGDVIRIQQTKSGWRVMQIPKVEGAIAAMDPNNGAVLAMAGGFDYQSSKFNRVVQAKRQPGSALKPFIYSAALDYGLTLASLINDAPIILGEEDQATFWRPQNHSKRFYGPTRIREGLVKSRNLVSVRILKKIGINFARTHLAKFGFDPSMQPQSLSMALGAGEVTPLNLTAGFSAFANGGFRISPFIIERIIDSDGRVLFQAKPKTACKHCSNHFSSTLLANMGDELPAAPRAVSPQNAYLIHHVLQDVVKRGTGRRALSLQRTDLAGKTGTTNNQMDAWFAGYHPDLAVTTWMGFDQPQTLHEYAATTSLPMWIDFMGKSLHNTPEKTLSQPAGIVAVRINKKTGMLARSGEKNTDFELFRRQYAPIADSRPSTYSTPQQNVGETVPNPRYNGEVLNDQGDLLQELF